jgi:protein-arginine kinase activator protein McsA
MKCERCNNVASEHIAIREGEEIRERHLCVRCADADAEIMQAREHAKQNRPQQRPANVHDFMRHWEERRRSLGRELSKEELIQLLDRLCD